MTARTAGGPFSPSRPTQRLNHRSYSPGTVTVAVVAATAAHSYAEAAQLLEITGDLTISSRHLQTLAQEIGTELHAETQQQTQAYRQRPLMTPPQAAQPPIPLAVVMVDGGRIQVRTPDQGPGVHDPAWRETKAAVLARMTHVEHAEDPQPEMPTCFARPLLGSAPAAVPAAAEPAAAPAPDDSPAAEPPRSEVIFRTGLATRADSEEFGWIVAAAAEQRGFFTAATGAFVGDGQTYNWTIRRRHFPGFQEILDFLHGSEHVHEAARAAGPDPELGRRWAEACWKGDVAAVLAELEQRQGALEPPPDPDAEPNHPWCVLNRERTYLENNRTRMDYPRYRREGLPITSSPVESWIKQINQRVKGSEKFWNDDEDHSEAILQLRAAWLSDDEALLDHLHSRPGHPYARPRDQRHKNVA